MSWLRLDDGFPEHRKVLELPRKDRWTWVELLCYVARQNNGGHVPQGICDILRWVTPAFIKQCVDVGLLDEGGSGHTVHDWDVYNPKDPSNAERQRRHRERYRNGERNGERNDWSNGESNALGVATVTDSVTASGTPPARARARGPSPTPVTTSSSSTKDAPEPHDDAETTERLKTAGWTDSRIETISGRGHLELAARWLETAEQDATIDNPGAYAYTMTAGGSEPTDTDDVQSTIAAGATGTRSKPTAGMPCPHCGIIKGGPFALEEHILNVHYDDHALTTPEPEGTIHGRPLEVRPKPGGTGADHGGTHDE